MESSPLILGLGAATWDRFLVVPEFPCEEGVTLASRGFEQGGGPVATALCTLAALGQHTALIDCQADDVTGHCILRELQGYGVDTSRIRVHGECAGASAQAQILVRERDGARHICYTPAACPELIREDLPPELLRSATLLHLNGRHENAAREAARLARQSGANISFDGGAGRYRESIRDLVLMSDLRILAKDFALKFAGKSSLDEAVRVLREDSPALLVITDGVHGSWTWSPHEESAIYQEAVPVSPVVDTTGCGDVFHGAFLHGWLKKWPLRETAAFAAKLAAENARGLGGRFALAGLKVTPR